MLNEASQRDGSRQGPRATQTPATSPTPKKRERPIMNNPRYETLFSIRYAIRVHERSLAFWGAMANLLKLMSILSGSAALMSVVGAESNTAVFLGLAFAFFQALEYSFHPTDKRYQALVQRKVFAQLYAKQAKFDDQALETTYRELVAEDETTPLNALKELAYNDVVKEQGSDESYCFANKHVFMAALS